MTFLQCHSDFEEHNQVLGRVNNNSKLIPEALVVPNETFEKKPEFQQQKGKAWSRLMEERGLAIILIRAGWWGVLQISTRAG